VRALVLYTGRETKIYLNNGKSTYKTSKLERTLNIMIIVNIVLLFVIDGIMSGKSLHFLKNNGPGMRYIFPRWNATLNIPETFASKNVAIFYLLLNTPLALVIVLEIAKQFYTKFVEVDYDMAIPDYITNDI
jgi:magnesium-transporting ATPase (P-type)